MAFLLRPAPSLVSILQYPKDGKRTCRLSLKRALTKNYATVGELDAIERF
jgi:hypothetical protein